MNLRPFFWWPAKDLIYVGEDEYNWRTLGFRLPLGVLFLRLWFDYKCRDEEENLRTWGVPNPPVGLGAEDLEIWREARTDPASERLHSSQRLVLHRLQKQTGHRRSHRICRRPLG